MPVSISYFTFFLKNANLFFERKKDLKNDTFHCDFFNILKIVPNTRRGTIYYQTRPAVFMK